LGLGYYGYSYFYYTYSYFYCTGAYFYSYGGYLVGAAFSGAATFSGGTSPPLAARTLLTNGSLLFPLVAALYTYWRRRLVSSGSIPATIFPGLAYTGSLSMI
jgi:hypothetical protein